ncbi:Fic family protein [Nocardia rosealba]|uniref:Fic family protein n=1 Tax=Nocardia rosealba TaxID=2878563 RepID=UPI001CD94E58|nr:Fic family protein [Nocardia rosealba]MCA2205790.1 Fic family protein [Nocardia rosealba]
MSSDIVWPAITWESHDWVPTIPAELLSRRVRERHQGPYQATIAPAIADHDVRLPADVLAVADEVTVEIARFDTLVGADLTPFGAILLRTESASSSQIEHLTSGAKAIALAEIGSGDQRNAVEIVGNVRAMRTALSLDGAIDDQLILRTHAALMVHEPDTAGRWRNQQVWIGGDNVGPHGAAFVAPHHDRVQDSIADLLAFIRRDNIPALAHTAIAHAQFETIHPFTDGNGRTGRALMHAMLRAKGVTEQVTVPIAAGLLTRVDDYFGALTAYRAGDPAPIVRQVAEASFAALGNARMLVDDIHQIRARWEAVVRARRGATPWRLMDVALRQPVFDAKTVAEALDITDSNAVRAIGTLVDAGILTEFTGMRRNRLWQTREVLDALDDFARRTGKRANAN